MEKVFSLRVYGENGGLEWAQEDPNKLWYTPYGEPKRLFTRNGAGASVNNIAASRIPAGHPEGYLEGFANIYAEAATAIRRAKSGASKEVALGALPDINSGMAGMRFISACVASSKQNAAWISLSG